MNVLASHDCSSDERSALSADYVEMVVGAGGSSVEAITGRVSVHYYAVTDMINKDVREVKRNEAYAANIVMETNEAYNASLNMADDHDTSN